MSNSIFSHLHIEGSADIIASLIDCVKDEKSLLSANKIIPMPTELNGTCYWYDWVNNNWGTKWGFYQVSQKWEIKDDFSATISFQTAWSPAFPLIDKMAQLFPQLKITYSFADEGGFFVGNAIYQNGQRSKTNNYNWDSLEGISIRKLVDYFYEDECEDDNECED